MILACSLMMSDASFISVLWFFGKGSVKIQQSRMNFQEVETIYVVGELKSRHRTQSNG